jgi:hypothetical protein
VEDLTQKFEMETYLTDIRYFLRHSVGKIISESPIIKELE